jgi:ABC-type glycerol-3-phosphate transport system substrate-binding protein
MFQPKKLLLLILALTMMLTVLVSCSKSQTNKNPTDTTASSTTTDTDDDDDESTSVLDGVSFNNESLKVLYWSDTNVTEYEEIFDANSSNLEQEVYNRCERSESQLNIVTTWVPILGNASNKEYITTAELANQNGGEYDLYVCYSCYAATLTTRGVFSNLKQYTYMDFDHAAWPQSLVEDCTLNDKLYFCTGDVSTNLIYMTSVVFFNTDMVSDYSINDKIKEQYGESSLYDLVTTGKWTFDALYSLSKDIYSDNNQNGKKDSSDTYGFGTYGPLLPNFYYGTGMKMVESTGSSITMSQDFYNSDKISTILSKAQEFLFDSNDAYYYGTSAYEATRNSFAAGLCLFSLAPASHAYVTHSKTSGLNYSVLPIPKYTESQDRYYSIHSLPYSMYGIATASKYQDITAAFLEALAENSYTTTRIAIYDKLMKYQYATDSIDSLMWDYVADSQVFDCSRIFQQSFTSGQSPTELFTTRLAADNSNWVSIVTSYQQSLETYCATISSELAALLG